MPAVDPGAIGSVEALLEVAVVAVVAVGGPLLLLHRWKWVVDSCFWRWHKRWPRWQWASCSWRFAPP